MPAHDPAWAGPLRPPACTPKASSMPETSQNCRLFACKFRVCCALFQVIIESNNSCRLDFFLRAKVHCAPDFLKPTC